MLIRYREEYPPGIQVTVEDMLAEGDMVMYRFTTRGTYMLKPAPPEGKKIQLIGFMQDRFEDGKIAETWELVNMLDFFNQLGIEPPRKR